MNNLNNVPWDQVANLLREEAVRHSGAKGALFGAGLGAATALAGMTAEGKRVTPQAILAAAFVGLAFGAADKTLLGD